MYEDGFDTVVREFWDSYDTGGEVNACIAFKDKLKGLKVAVREWWALVSAKKKADMIAMQNRLHDIDVKMDQGVA